MANNIEVTAGTGTVVSTEEITTLNGGATSAAHAQRTVLTLRTGSATAVDVPGDATNGLDVDVTRLRPDGTNTLPAMDTVARRGYVQVTDGTNTLPTMDTAARRAYVQLTDGTNTAPVDNDKGVAVLPRRDLQRISVQSAGLTTATTAYTSGDQVGNIFTLTNAARNSGGCGVITGVMLISAADIIGAYDVVFFDSTVTLAADNAAFAISDADALKLAGLVQLVGAWDIGNNRIAQAFNLSVPYMLSGGTSLFAALITRAGHTFFGAVGDLQLVVFVERC